MILAHINGSLFYQMSNLINSQSLSLPLCSLYFLGDFVLKEDFFTEKFLLVILF